MDALQNNGADSKSLVLGEDYAPDRRRKQLLWLALSLVGFLTLAVVLLVAYGAEIASTDYSEPLLLIGLLAFVTCTVAYFADKEREQRAENRRLIHQLHDTARALDTRVARLNKLSETSARLAGALDLDRISELVVEALAEQVQADAASLVLLDRSKGEYLHTRSVGAFSDTNGDPGDPIAFAKAATEGRSSTGQSGGPVGRGDQLKAWERIRASISAPVKVSDVVGGALAAIREETFDTEDLNLLTTLANMSSKAIESAELHQQLREAYYRTLHVLARSLAARDPYSAAHGEAVTWLACCLAKNLRLGEEAVEALQSYAPLHDLGKIGIPDAVLSKEGPLTEDEFEMVRQHTVIGQNIIQPLSPGAPALSMIRSHHERWDGSGYPDGLKEEQIPMLARVMSVADAFHAIVSHRSYRPGAIPFKAVQEIRAMAGTQFDPTVAETLVKLWESGELTQFAAGSGESAQGYSILDVAAALSAPGPRLNDAGG
ncbi:MAG: HD domain-containing protein [Anaerolineae bacterium]|nr:HD domain-containing protein [Anaerolineae bacterium]